MSTKLLNQLYLKGKIKNVRNCVKYALTVVAYARSSQCLMYFFLLYVMFPVYSGYYRPAACVW